MFPFGSTELWTDALETQVGAGKACEGDLKTRSVLRIWNQYTTRWYYM